MTRRTRLFFEALEDRSLLSFSPATSYRAGPNPQDVVAADFNNDGRLDLATANADSNSVSVLLDNGDGTFQPAQTSATEWAPHRLAVADFNNDGWLDLATRNPYHSGANLLLGNGDGTFQAPVLIDSLAWGVVTLAAADVNQDGHADLVFAATDPDFGASVEVQYGDGRGGFAPADWVFLSGYYSYYSELAVADLNADGWLDVIAVDEYRKLVSVLLNDGQGNLAYTPDSSDFNTGNNTRGVAVGDFTGDGIPDVAAAGYTRVAVLPGDGHGAFGSPIVELTNNSNQTAVAAADFSGDGRLDVVTPDESEGVVTAVLGQGDGTLRLYGDHPVGAVPAAVAIGDFNGDGRPDVATADAGSDTVSVLLNDGDWTPPPPPPPALRIGDHSVTEGNTGTASATFTVTLSAPSTQPVTVVYATADGSATAGSDYQAASGTLTFAPGETSQTITVLVNGDRTGEANETFVVNLSSPTNATIADGQGVGTILDDEPRVSIGDVTRHEGKKNQTTLFTFTVTLSVAYDQPVTMSFRTANGTATTADGDYAARSGTLTFNPGETTKTITIEVKGDNKREANETFYLDLSGLSGNALLTKNRGVGTILNDD